MLERYRSAAGERLPESVLVTIRTSGAPVAAKQRLHLQAEKSGQQLRSRKMNHRELDAGHEGKVEPKSATSDGRGCSRSPCKRAAEGEKGKARAKAKGTGKSGDWWQGKRQGTWKERKPRHVDRCYRVFSQVAGVDMLPKTAKQKNFICTSSASLFMSSHSVACMSARERTFLRNRHFLPHLNFP